MYIWDFAIQCYRNQKEAYINIMSCFWCTVVQDVPICIVMVVMEHAGVLVDEAEGAMAGGGTWNGSHQLVC